MHAKNWRFKLRLCWQPTVSLCINGYFSKLFGRNLDGKRDTVGIQSTHIYIVEHTYSVFCCLYQFSFYCHIPTWCLTLALGSGRYILRPGHRLYTGTNWDTMPLGGASCCKWLRLKRKLQYWYYHGYYPSHATPGDSSDCDCAWRILWSRKLNSGFCHQT